MLIPTIVMAVLAVVLLLVGYFQGQGQHVEGIKAAARTTAETLPLLLFAFVVAGMAQVLIPREVVSEWVGAESGMRGILIGSVVGALTPGGPYVSFPVAAVFLRTGASLGTVVAFVTAWSLWSLSRLPMEVGLLGWRVTLIRVATTFVVPPLAGWTAQMLFGNS